MSGSARAAKDEIVHIEMLGGLKEHFHNFLAAFSNGLPSSRGLKIHIICPLIDAMT